MKVYKIYINDETGMECVSLVDQPAVEIDFLTFDEMTKLSFNKEKSLITGVVALADVPIYRYSQKQGEYYIIFDKETIQTMVYKYSKEGYFNNTSINHDGVLLSGLVLVESYFTDDTKPSPFKVPEGSWVVTYKCENEEVWKLIEEGKLKGFSLEGLFCLVEADQDIDKLIDDILNEK